MKIKSLQLQNFRNIKNLKLECDPKINFIVGKNAQGKTSILEAIHILSTLKSFRSHRADDYIQHHSDYSDLNCEIINPQFGDNFKTILRVFFQKNDVDKDQNKKIAYINGKTYKSTLKFLSEKFFNPLYGYHSIVFNPSDHNLVRGEPKERRNVFNAAISSQDIEYLDLLKRYERVLIQRNALLKSKEIYKNFSDDLFFEYTEQLIKYASKITFKRLNWLIELNRIFLEICDEISPIKKGVYTYCFAYQSSWLFPQEMMKLSGHFECPSIEIIDGKLREYLKAHKGREFRQLTTIAGPHKDDFLFIMNNHLLKAVGSQGEIRTALLAFKLSEVKLYENKTKTLPLFLLDDFSSELDEERRNLLLEKLLEMNVQTFVTTTDRYFLKKEYPSFFIEEGSLLGGEKIL